MSVLFYFYCTKLMKQKASVDNNDFLLSRNFHVYFYYFFWPPTIKLCFHISLSLIRRFFFLYFSYSFFSTYFFFSTSSTAQLCLRLKTYNYELTFTFSWPFINHISISSFFSFLLFLCFCISLPWNSI